MPRSLWKRQAGAQTMSRLCNDFRHFGSPATVLKKVSPLGG